MKLIRTLFSIFALLVIVGVIAIACLVWLVDPNKLKPVLTQEVAQRTGYQLIIDGNLSWSFYPMVGIKAEHAQLRSPDSSVVINMQDAKFVASLTQFLHMNHQLQGTLYLPEIKIANVVMQDISTAIWWKDETLKLNQIQATFYHGTVNGLLEITQLSSLPLWNWQLHINNMEIKSFLEDANPRNALKLSGVAQVTMNASTAGKTGKECLENLNGTNEFTIKKGMIDGIDVNNFIQAADAFAAKQPTPAVTQNPTNFDTFTGSAMIKNGVAEANNAMLIAPSFVAKLQGSLDLVNQTMDLRLHVVPVNATKLKGAVPIIVSGSMANPSIRLDMLMLKTMVMRDQLDQVKSTVAADVKKLPEKADKFLKKILGK